MFKKLIEVWKKESSNQPLQPIERHFYDNLATYKKDLTSRLTIQNGLQKKIIKKELENARIILEKIVDLRIKKILQAFMNGKTIETKNLAEDELELAETVSTLINKVNELKNFFSGVSKTEEKGSERVIIRFLKPIPRIVCTDLKAYGPFVPEDVSSVPVRDAEKLMERGVAVRLNPFRRGSARAN